MEAQQVKLRTKENIFAADVMLVAELFEDSVHIRLEHRRGAPRSSMYRYAVDSVNRCAALCPARSGEEYRRLTVVGDWLLRDVSHD